MDVNNTAYTVAGWSVDPASLRICKHEKEIKLEPKAMAVLEYLAARPGQVVSRQELEAAVWTNTVVGYDAISNAIIKLRKAFSDKAQNPRIIETIPKAGYRLIATVENSAVNTDADESLPPGPLKIEKRATLVRMEMSRWFNQPTVKIFLLMMLLAGVAALWFKPAAQSVEPALLERMAFALPEKPSLAVLPFANLSIDPQLEYFADGFTDDLITDLSKEEGLFIIARNSVFIYKGKPVKIHVVAEELGVRYVLQGSVRRDDNQVRINAQLIDTQIGRFLWTERYDGSLDEIFSMQDKVTNKIVKALIGKLVVPANGNQLITAGNSDAYDVYLRGWERYRLGTSGDLSLAVGYLEQAIELDPEFARARSALAAVYWKIAANGWWNKSLHLSVSQAYEQSRVALVRAMQHDSALNHQVASERAAYFLRTPDKALAEAERALVLDSNDPAGHLAMANALLKANRAAEAVESVRAGMRLDPHYPPSFRTRLGQAQFANGEYAMAVETLQTAARRNPNDDWTFVYLAAAFGQLDNEPEAKLAVEKANTLRAKEGWGRLTLENTRRRSFHGGLNYFQWVGDFKPLREGLRKAGVTREPEWFSLVRMDPTNPGIKGATTIDAKTAKALHDRGVPFIDVFVIGLTVRIPGAYFLEEYTDEFNDARLAAIVGKNQEVVIYSSRSNRGSNQDRYIARATARAVSWGYEKVYYFPDGLDLWKAAGYPVETDN